MSDAVQRHLPALASVTVRVARREAGEDPPRWDEFVVPYEKWMTVNDALDYVTDELEEDVAYRRFCGVKKCGTCAIRVNGREVLACWEPITTETVELEPLRHLPVIRDLVVDREPYEEVVRSADPLLERAEEPREFPEPLPHTQMRNAPALDCLSCLACVSAMPVGAEGTDALAPAVLVQIAQLALDPRDSRKNERLKALGPGVLDRSYQAGSDVCPAGIDIDRDVVAPLRAQEAK